MARQPAVAGSLCRVSVCCVALGLTLALACRSESPPSAISTALQRGEPVDWPLRLAQLRPVRQACRTDFCLAGDALDLVFNRAALWMAGYEYEVRFDAAVGLSQIRRTVTSPDFDRAWSAAVTVADRETDHPHRRFWMPEFRSPQEITSRWAAAEANFDQVLSEALHCRENGWRAETTAYVCGPIRDRGDYGSVRGLWALTVARENNCVDDSILPCARELQAEIAKAQPRALEPRKTLDIELYAERLRTLLLSGYGQALVHDWARSLIAFQISDGAWAVGVDDDPYNRYRATSAATWALAEWLRLLAADRGRALTLGALRVQAPFPIGGATFWGCSLPGTN
jgi:hypothetical protein